MEKLLTLLIFITALLIAIFAQPDGPLAVMFGAGCTVIAILFINSFFEDEEKSFLRLIFNTALLLRLLLAVATYTFNLQGFFGGDSITYDYAGYALYQSWFDSGAAINSYYLNFATRASGSGWGMGYVVAAVYTLVGRNTLAVQMLNCVLGALTACLTYTCTKNLFNNQRVARLATIMVAVFPSLVLWSSQGLKDGIICFLLVLSMNMVFSLQKKLDYVQIGILLMSLAGIYALRFYIFFAFAASIFGSFFLSTQKSASSIAKQVVVLVLITIGLTYFGVLSGAQTNLERYGNLKTLQESRKDAATSAESGFGQDIDVSTSSGAISALPIGLAYIMLAPFPWELGNFRQAITLPEVLVWWGLIPFMIVGIAYAIKNKFRSSLGVLMFTLLLTVSYAIFQGNVGTAYRMRAQMQIFYFIFVAAGLVIWQEKRENKALLLKSQRQRSLQRQVLARKQS